VDKAYIYIYTHTLCVFRYGLHLCSLVYTLVSSEVVTTVKMKGFYTEYGGVTFLGNVDKHQLRRDNLEDILMLTLIRKRIIQIIKAHRLTQKLLGAHRNF
jgi:hypothetical protein